MYHVQDGNQTKELEMKVTEITEGYYDASPFAQKMARYGRTLQQLGQGSGEAGSLKKRKGEGDKEYDARLDNMNKMGSLGSALTSVGNTFGIKDPTEGSGDPKQRLAKFFADLEQACGCDKPTIMKMLKQAEANAGMKTDVGVKDPEPQDEPDDEPEDRAPSDDEIDRDAKDFARG